MSGCCAALWRLLCCCCPGAAAPPRPRRRRPGAQEDDEEGAVRQQLLAPAAGPLSHEREEQIATAWAAREGSLGELRELVQQASSLSAAAAADERRQSAAGADKLHAAATAAAQARQTPDKPALPPQPPMGTDAKSSGGGAAQAAAAAALPGAPGDQQQQEAGRPQQPSAAPLPPAAAAPPPPPRPTTPPPARLSRGGLNAVSAAACDLDRTVVVMRHGHRQDEADATWTRVATRPWDPPLSSRGRTQAREAAAPMRDLRIDLVVSSPFKRCLQTGAEIVAALGLPQDAWLVDWGLSEICDPRVLLHGRPDCEHMAKGRPIAEWMWGGATMEEALTMFAESCAEQLPALQIRPIPRPGAAPPPFPESLEGGLKRYARAVQQLVWAFPGRRVLVVTHGECVRAVVNMMEPHSEVFEVRHVGYVQLDYSAPSPGYTNKPPGDAASDDAAPLLAGAGANSSGTPQQQQQQQQQQQREEEKKGEEGDSTADGGNGGGGGLSPGWRLASSPTGETGVFWLFDDGDA